MSRLIQTLALGGSLVVISVGLWRDYEVGLTIKQALIAYIAVYFLAGVFLLIGRAAVQAVKEPPQEEPDDDIKTKNRRPHKQERSNARDNASPPTGAADEARPEAAALHADNT